MLLWKYDLSTGTVREIEGEPWPGHDADGDICYENSHFKTEAKAWESLIGEVTAWVKLSGRRVAEAKSRLVEAEKKAGEAAAAFMLVHDSNNERMRALASDV